jgi:hypothetical protein
VKYKIGNQIQNTKVLSTRTKEILQKNAKLRGRDSKLVKMQSGKKRVFQFDLERTEQVEADLMERRLLGSDTH